jgi:hypothetical protein
VILVGRSADQLADVVLDGVFRAEVTLGTVTATISPRCSTRAR